MGNNLINNAQRVFSVFSYTHLQPSQPRSNGRARGKTSTHATATHSGLSVKRNLLQAGLTLLAAQSALAAPVGNRQRYNTNLLARAPDGASEIAAIGQQIDALQGQIATASPSQALALEEQQLDLMSEENRIAAGAPATPTTHIQVTQTQIAPSAVQTPPPQPATLAPQPPPPKPVTTTQAPPPQPAPATTQAPPPQSSAPQAPAAPQQTPAADATASLYPSGAPQVSDVNQGHSTYAQCAIDATAAAMAQQMPNAITSAIKSTGPNTYAVQIYPGGAPTTESVTPADIETNNMTDGSNGQLDWSSVLQAAVHKVDAQNGWTLLDAVQILTGGRPATGAPSDLGDSLANTLANSLSQGHVVIAGTTAEGTTSTGQQIAGGHAYTVLAVHNGQITVRNPWGNHHKGLWGDADQTGGVLTMSAADFARLFVEVAY